MADALDLLAASLLRDQASYKTEDPFYSAGVGLDKVLQTAPAYHLKPWQSILAGVLGGFGSGVLKGIGTASADQKASSIATKLATALQAAPEDRAELFKDIPGGAKYGALLGVQDVVDKEEAKKSRRLLLDKLATQDPKIFQVQQGTQNITMQRDPLTGVVSQIGAGPKFAPRADTAIPDAAGSKLAQLAAALQGEETPDEGTAAAFQNKDTARIATALLQQQGVGNRFATDQTTQRKLADKKADAANFINSADAVLSKLEKFDPNEDIVGATARAVQAKILPDSEAADLDRMLAGTTFEALKPTFPGQLSDAEREAMQSVMGRQTGVTVGKLREILNRQKEKAALKFDTTLGIEQERGIKTDIKPFSAKSAAPPPVEGYKPGDKVRNPKTGQVATLLDDGSWEVR